MLRMTVISGKNDFKSNTRMLRTSILNFGILSKLFSRPQMLSSYMSSSCIYHTVINVIPNFMYLHVSLVWKFKGIFAIQAWFCFVRLFFCFHPSKCCYIKFTMLKEYLWFDHIKEKTYVEILLDKYSTVWCSLEDKFMDLSARAHWRLSIIFV